MEKKLANVTDECLEPVRASGLLAIRSLGTVVCETKVLQVVSKRLYCSYWSDNVRSLLFVQYS